MSLCNVLCVNYTSLKLKKENKKELDVLLHQAWPLSNLSLLGFFPSAFRPQIVSVVKIWEKEVSAKLALKLPRTQLYFRQASARLLGS